MKKMIFLSVLFFFSLINSFGQGTWSQSNLSTFSFRMGTASHGSKVYFAGGTRGSNFFPSTLIDIYDVNTQQWTTSNLSTARELSAGISNGSKVIFGGGINLTTSVPSAVVDIYDTQTQQWTTAQLSQPRFSIATVSYGNEVLFAGGMDFQTNQTFAAVDKYNTLTGVWSTTALSEDRAAMGFAVADTKALFAGGITFPAMTPTNTVDIYDFITGTWTKDTLSLARGFLSATAVGNKIIIAGGVTAPNTPSDRVDIYDVSTGIWTTSHLSAPRAFMDYATSACGNAFFVGGGNFNYTAGVWTTASNVVDIYDPVRGIWTVDYIPGHPLVFHSVVANGNRVFVAGGTDFIYAFETVDIYTCSTVGIEKLQNDANLFNLYPNPTNEIVTISYPLLTGKNITVTITDISGRMVFKTGASQTEKTEVNTKNFEAGVYLIQVQTSDFISTRKLIVAN